MRKRLLAIIATAAMVVAMVPSMAFAAPVVSGDVINVADAADAQAVLDGEYGNIDGKTINFTDNIETVLDLARPTKHEDSGTIYYNYVNYALESSPTPWSDNISTIMNSHSHYYRTVKNVTFTADKGVTVAGFIARSGHKASSGHDYVREVDQTSGVTHYDHRTLSGITFDGITVTGSIDFGFEGLEGTSVKDVTIKNCNFIGTTAEAKAQAIRMWSDTMYYENVKVADSTIKDYYQGVYIHGVDGVEIANNSISNTVHNAIAIQSTYNPTKGNIVIKENYMENVSDRAIRVNNVADATFAVNNNIMVNCGDDEGEMFKATDMGNGTADLENNYWDGKDPKDAVKGTGVIAPTKTGIIGGTFFGKDVTDFLAAGYEQNSTTGEVGVEGSFDQDTPTPDQSQTETKPAEDVEESEDTVDTGDNMNMAIPFAIAGIALATMAAVVATRRREN